MPKGTQYTSTVSQDKKDFFLWGIFFLLLCFTLALIAYYTHFVPLRYLSFFSLLSSLLLLFWSIKKDLDKESLSPLFSWLLVIILFLLYFSLRTALHRFDFSVGDPSDYYLAGVCSITYGQDIGFFLPLTASISAIGFTIFGLDYAPAINVVLLASALPLSYFLFKALGLNSILSLTLTLFLTVLPLNIWLSRTSFSDPIWQLFLLSFILISLRMMHQKKYHFPSLFLFYTILLLTPFLRGEAVLYYGIVFALALYHFFTYQNIKTATLIMLGTLIISLSIHATLGIRSNYLLHMQFNRIIPHINKELLLTILYGATGGFFTILSLLALAKNKVKSFNAPLWLTLLSLIFKIGIIYIYSYQKHLNFLDLFFLNEYSFAVGNFGIPLTFIILVGLFLLYYHAIKGKTTALILVFVYTIFYISFIMQKITFFDSHAFLYYWNRYYLSMLLLIHLSALALAINLLYQSLNKWIPFISLKNITILILFTLISLSSMNLKMYPIVIQESHQKNNYLLVPWLKKHIGGEPLSVVYDSSMVYHQNKGHIGINHIKYLISRTFSVFKINAKGYQGVTPEKLNETLPLHIDLSDRKYLLCVSSKKCSLDPKRFTYIDTLELPLKWREHLGLSLSKIQRNTLDLSQSHINQWKLYFVLYKIKEKFGFNKKLQLNGASEITRTIFNKGWYATKNDTGVWMKKMKATMYIPPSYLSQSPLHIKLDYFIFNASSTAPKTVQFILNNQLLKEITTQNSTMQSLTLNIPKTISKTEGVRIDIEVSPKYSLPKKRPYSFYIKSLQIINKNK